MINIGLIHQIDQIDVNTYLKFEKARLLLEKILVIKEEYEKLGVRYNLVDANAQLGYINFKCENWSKSIDFFKRALDIIEKHKPVNQKYRANLLAYIGYSESKLGRKTKAIENYEQAYKAFQTDLAKNTDDPLLLFVIDNLANFFEDNGEYKDALNLHKEAFDIQQAILEPNHLDSAKTCDQIGNAYYNLGELDLAFEQFDRALSIRELNRLPEDHVDMAYSYMYLGSYYRKKTEYDRAINLYTKALDILKKELNFDYVVNILNYMGIVHYKLQNYDKALEIYQESLYMFKLIYAADKFEEKANIYNNISIVLNRLGRNEEALENAQIALDIRRKIFTDANHPDIKSSEDIIKTLAKALA